MTTMTCRASEAGLGRIVGKTKLVTAATVQRLIPELIQVTSTATQW
jgi:hypothetical protein